jgi:hypothetical protein
MNGPAAKRFELVKIIGKIVEEKNTRNTAGKERTRSHTDPAGKGQKKGGYTRVHPPFGVR